MHAANPLRRILTPDSSASTETSPLVSFLAILSASLVEIGSLASLIMRHSIGLQRTSAPSSGEYTTMCHSIGGTARMGRQRQLYAALHDHRHILLLTSNFVPGSSSPGALARIRR
jgi:hypothetical protein